MCFQRLYCYCSTALLHGEAFTIHKFYFKWHTHCLFAFKSVSIHKCQIKIKKEKARNKKCSFFHGSKGVSNTQTVLLQSKEKIHLSCKYTIFLRFHISILLRELYVVLGLSKVAFIHANSIFQRFSENNVKIYTLQTPMGERELI